MIQLEDGRWKVDLDGLPDGMLAWNSQPVIDHPHDLLELHAKSILVHEAEEQGLDCHCTDEYIESWFTSKKWRFRLAMEQAEGKYGPEIQHARLLRRAEDLAKRRGEGRG